MNLEQLYSQYADWVFRKCRGYTRTHQDAEDLVHDIFIGVERNLKKFDQKSSVFTWLYKITINHCYMYLRKYYRESQRFESLLEEPKDHQTEGSCRAMTIDLQRVFTDLDKKTGRILFLTAVEGLTQEEAATMTGISRRALHKRVKKHHSTIGSYFEER